MTGSGEVGSARGSADFLGISAGTAISGVILLTTPAQAAAALVTKNPELGRLTVLDPTPSSVGFVDNDDLALRLAELGFDSADIVGAVEINIEARLDCGQRCSHWRFRPSRRSSHSGTCRHGSSGTGKPVRPPSTEPNPLLPQPARSSMDDVRRPHR